MADTVQVNFDGDVVEAHAGDIFGRGNQANVTIAANVVSRRHAQLNRGPDGWYLSDLGSANGLFGPDGVEASVVELPAGTTRVSLGPPANGCELHFTVHDAEPTTVRADGGDLADAVTLVAPRVEVGPGSSHHEPPGGYQPAIQGLAPLDAEHSPAGPPSTTDGVSVRAEGLTVVVDDDLTILNPTSLSLAGGTMTAIIGPSGCGKSTLANLLSGRSEPTSGSVSIDTQPMSEAVRKRIGVVPQYDAVHEQLTVKHALRAAARLRLSSTTPTAAIHRSVQATAAVLGLDERLNTRVAKLSGGQKKRVSVGYELVSNPVMMVLDEPTSGLDPGLEQELITELRALADRGTTTVLVTHSTEAAEQADVVVVMAPGGHVAFVGAPAEVLAHFGVDDWADIFNRLTAESGPRWAAYFSGTPAYAHHVATPPPDPVGGQPIVTRHERSWLGDFQVMTMRYLRSIVADWRSLTLLAAQAPILGFLFALVLSRTVFRAPIRPSTSAREFVLAAVLAMVWIGASNSIREIVKERKTFLRERAVGVAPSALVASRWAVLAGITLIQSVILYYAATSRQLVPLTDGVLISSGPLELMVALALVGLASVGIGLVISGAVADSSKAMALLPIVLIPIVLFSGLLIPTAGQPGIEQVSWINPVQWPSSAAAATASVLEKEGCNPTGLQAQLQQAFLGRTISCANPRWQPTTSAQLVNFGVGAVQVAVLVVLSFVVTARSTRVIRI